MPPRNRGDGSSGKPRGFSPRGTLPTARHGRGFSKSNIALMRAFSSNGKFSRHRQESRSQGQGFAVLPAPWPFGGRKPRHPARTHLRDLIPRRGLSAPPGPTTSSSWRWITPTPAASTKPRRSRGGWSVRQLRRQIGSQFYERTACRRTRLAC